MHAEPAEPLYDWRVFADATCAGLAVLIPLPLVDLAFEMTFRRRIPWSVARFRKRPVERVVARRLGGPLYAVVSMRGCVGAVVAAIRWVVRRIWRKIIYVLAITDAVTALTEYWHRAALIDHMVRAGHLDRGVNPELPLRVCFEVLRDIDPSPLTGAARQTVANVHHVFRLLLQARRLGAAEVTRSIAGLLTSHWDVAERSLRETTSLYNRRYATAVAAAADLHESENGGRVEDDSTNDAS
jgi:hypothetical protein